MLMVIALIAVIGIMAGLAVPLIEHTADKAITVAAKRNAENICQLYNLAVQAHARFTDNTSKQAIARNLSDGVTGVDNVMPFKLSMSEGAITAALKYCSLDTGSNQMIHNPNGNEDDVDWSIWNCYSIHMSAEETLSYVEDNNANHAYEGTREYRVDSSDPLIVQCRDKL
jgi:type II secretory pathway pseudopilin PulG